MPALEADTAYITSTPTREMTQAVLQNAGNASLEEDAPFFRVQLREMAANAGDAVLKVLTPAGQGSTVLGSGIRAGQSAGIGTGLR